MKILIYDTETTGLNNPKACQIGGIIVDSNTKKIEHSFSYLLNPGKPIELQATAVHHITNEMVENTYSYETIKPYFEGLVNSVDLVAGYNSLSFDNTVMLNDGTLIPVEKTLDIWRVAFGLLQESKVEEFGQIYLHYYFGLNSKVRHQLTEINSQFNPHDVITDVAITNSLFDYFSNLSTIEGMLQFTRYPIKVTKLKFGKHKDQRLEDIASFDPGYLMWLYKSELEKPDNKRNGDLCYTIDTLLSINSNPEDLDYLSLDRYTRS